MFDVIPENTKTKAPSADLYGGQTDEEELGFSYSELDEILDALHRGDSVKLDSLNIENIGKVQAMIHNNAHKNNAPPRYEREILAVDIH